MIGKLVDLALRLSRRERVLLGFMAGIALPAGIGFGVLLPLHEARLSAEATVTETAALQLWVADRAAEARVLTASPAVVAQSYAPIGLSGLEEGLKSSKLRSSLTELGTETGGLVVLRFDDVDFVRMATWLTSSHPHWGYEINSYRFETINKPSRVSARIELQATEN
ncbi:type II secretion system protein GspM [Pelagimonas varians]|uniref:General secretion pathway, M protein n=1 Tax=Pelagimonas varians TaxID=696760 RepID=A0A238L0N6_9RHOB|nr:type II secretion system protein GspM [Pelagimonas varians]PYG27247.1 type II secretory pathway component PulM [Pelagimonas varians]SMX48655.1 General secretion pathway, M protein [Pelagimonas varians]